MPEILLENQPVKVENIFCIGRNYKAHIEELNHRQDSEILVFLKPTSSLTCAQTVHLPDFSDDVHYEGELIILIGQNAGDECTEKNAIDKIAGYGIGLDLTARDIQATAIAKGSSWLKAKGFRDAAAVSRFIHKDKISDIQNVRYTLSVNGKICQEGDTAMMIHSVAEIIAYLANTYGLQAGDLIFTGTPAGVGKMHSGQQLHLNLADLLSADFVVA